MGVVPFAVPADIVRPRPRPSVPPRLPESARERARTTKRGAAEERIDRDARAKSPTLRRPHTFVRFREQNPRCGAERRSRQRAPARGRFPTTTPAGVRLLPGSRVSGRTGALRHQEAEPLPEGPPLRRRRRRTQAHPADAGACDIRGRWSASPTSTRVGGAPGEAPRLAAGAKRDGRVRSSRT